MSPSAATHAQNRAANPLNSTWVSANAGSGKTRVLTDRVARLLLRNVPPQKILCLTYTKAAAAHMQNQLFNRLGAWSMLPDAELAERLRDLGEDMAGTDPVGLGHARTLFARALETPGGLKIQTIHSFCAALLRRFPLEAGVSPLFREMDERSARLLRADVLQSLAEGPAQSAFDGMAAFLSGDDPDRLVQDILRYRDGFSPALDGAAIWKMFHLAPGYDSADYLAEVWPEGTGELLHDLKCALETGGETDIKNAARLANIDLGAPTLDTAGVLEKMFVFGLSSKTAPEQAKTTFPTQSVRRTHPELFARVHALMLKYQDARPRRLALAAAQKTLALHRFAQVFLPAFERRKQAHGWLDFDDLILKARDLLSNSSMAQWVLFRLDGGIDHILVDEAQDTSPAQWSVIARLAEEFSTGLSAREVQRTLFVVGDEKQSIYSFQGADPDAFGDMRDRFESRLLATNAPLVKHDLLFSFRSSSAILRLVDCVFQPGNGGFAGTTTHRAFFEELPGRVDLWPFLTRSDAAEPGDWFDPVDAPPPGDPSIELAGQIADGIKTLLDGGETLPTTDGVRPIKAGDFLILVQRRSDLFHEIIRALKDRDLPVAGADRLKIGGELAVRDLVALLSFLATPEDDLALAEALRSPLFGLTEADLFNLAANRTGHLWESLRANRDTFVEAFEIASDLLAQTDFLRPYEILERILTRHNGRDRLVGRLGREAEDGIDALLTQALQYEQLAPPSLIGFLEWMSLDEGDIKRQIDSDSNEIRVMTVHGAKGLEAPIVILPDTAKRQAPRGSEVVVLPNGTACWKSARESCPRVLREAIDARQSKDMAERMRVLYVALTRAETWLIVCGAGDAGKPGESWYTHVAAALDQLGTETVSFCSRPIRRFQTLSWEQPATRDVVPALAADRPVLPGWSRTRAPLVEKVSPPLSPSDLGGEKVLSGVTEIPTPGFAEDVAMVRGTLIHRLLEHLPPTPPENRAARAEQILQQPGDPLQTSLIPGVLAEALTVLDSPECAAIFAPDALTEVPLAASLGGRVLFGVIDRLLIWPDRVLAVDFKTNSTVPDSAQETPEGLLRQMGAYSLALGQIYPNRKIETAILWTKTARLMPLPHKIVTDALNRATLP